MLTGWFNLHNHGAPAPPPGSPPPPPPPGGGTPPPPPPAGGPPAPPPPGPPHDPQAEAFRAGFELDSAYRDLRRGALMVQQMETYAPQAPEIADARQVFEIASRLYQTAFQARQVGQHLKAAEYAVAVKDLMRALDKFYNVMFASW